MNYDLKEIVKTRQELDLLKKKRTRVEDDLKTIVSKYTKKVRELAVKEQRFRETFKGDSALVDNYVVVVVKDKIYIKDIEQLIEKRYAGESDDN